MKSCTLQHASASQRRGQIERVLQMCRIDVEWARGRLFDQDTAQLFQLLVIEARSMRCTGVSTTEERRQRPHGETRLDHADYICGLGMQP